MRQFDVTGMSCAACSAHVEKAVAAVDGVDKVSVNLLTNSMNVEGAASDEAIVSAVVKAGYGASLKQKAVAKKEAGSSFEDSINKEFYTLRARLIASVVFVVPLMIFAMWMPDFINPMALGLTELLLSIIVIFINKKFFISGFKGLINRALNMDSLVALGSGASFVYSLINLFLMMHAISAAFSMDVSMSEHGLHEICMPYLNQLYFDSAAMILALITVGKTLEAYSKGRTTDALKSLMKLAPKTAVVLKTDADGNETEVEISVDEVKPGDIFMVKPGMSIPVDGVVLSGVSAVDESMLSGESIPVDKEEGDEISAGTINKSGFLKCKATKVGEDTSLAGIIRMVADASATKAPIAKIADKVSGVFVPIVVLIALITLIIWMIVSKDMGYSLSRAISVLVISCPCALGLATPVAIMVGNGMGAKAGVLFKNAESLEITGKVDVLLLDKTGTVTYGKPVVTDILPAEGVSEEKLLEIAYALEKKSEHPLALAICEYAEEKGIAAIEADEFEALSGNGVKAVINGQKILGGSLKFVENAISIGDRLKEKSMGFASEGKTPTFFAIDGKLAGIIAIADKIKDDAKDAVAEFENMGIKVLMLTGDNVYTARAVAKKAGIKNVISDVLPADKERIVKDLKAFGKVAMVGDGINDAPALVSAHVGLAIGAGTDVAIDAADVVLVKSNLKDVAVALRLSRATIRDIHQNLFWAFIYNIIGIPLAAGAYIYAFGWELNPMFGAAAMSLSSIFVVGNALRLNLKNIKSDRHDKKRVNKEFEDKFNDYMANVTVGNNGITEESEDNKMTKEIKIEGMMCTHCEAHVKEALEKIDGVISANPSHEKNNCVLELSKEISDNDINAAVEAAGYKMA